MIKLNISSLYLLLFIINTCSTANGQPIINHRVYDCGWYIKNFEHLSDDYYHSEVFAGCKNQETIASIGAGNGQREVTISAFVDSINWYLQDIDTTCLNRNNFNKVIAYFEKLKKAPITGSFRLVAGGEKKTNLPSHTFDRVILMNVYHELLYPDSIMQDIRWILKPGGAVVIQGFVARVKGQLHPQCGRPLIWEPEFLATMRRDGYILINKSLVNAKFLNTCYTFRLEQ